MPTYSYECKKCEAVTDVFHAISATPKVTCAACGSDKVIRLLGTGSGLIFKGSGFYETDYKRSKASTTSDGKPTSKESAKPTESKSSGESKSTKGGGTTEAA